MSANSLDKIGPVSVRYAMEIRELLQTQALQRQAAEQQAADAVAAANRAGRARHVQQGEAVNLYLATPAGPPVSAVAASLPADTAHVGLENSAPAQRVDVQA